MPRAFETLNPGLVKTSYMIRHLCTLAVPKFVFPSLVTLKEVIWHQMLTLKNKGSGKVAPDRVGVGDGIFVR